MKIPESDKSNVKVLNLAKLEPNMKIVEILENLLKKAKLGEIKAIAVAVHVHPNCTGIVHHIGENGDMAHLVLALERAKLRLLEVE